MSDNEHELPTDVSDADLMASAFQDEPPAEEPEASPPAADDGDKPRDEHGRFAAKPQESAPEVAKPQNEPAASEPPADSGEDRVRGEIPAWRLKEEADARRAAEQRAQEFERRAVETERRLQEIERREAESRRAQEPIDPLADPNGYKQALEEKFERQRQEDRLENNLQVAQLRHGEVFDTAYQAFLQAAERDRAFGQNMVRSANPGEAIVQWHRREQTLARVGSDPDAYEKSVLEKALENPEFLSRAMEKIKAQASGGQPTPNAASRPNTVTRLPPSLNSATSAASSHADELVDMSDRELLADALGRRR